MMLTFSVLAMKCEADISRHDVKYTGTRSRPAYQLQFDQIVTKGSAWDALRNCYISVGCNAFSIDRKLLLRSIFDLLQNYPGFKLLCQYSTPKDVTKNLPCHLTSQLMFLSSILDLIMVPMASWGSKSFNSLSSKEQAFPIRL